MKRTTQIVVDTISAQEAADHLALLSDNLMDAVELKTDLSQSDLVEKEREKEEKELSDSDNQPAIQLASAGGIVDVTNAAMIDVGSEVEQQTYESYADETGGGSSGISPWLAIGGGVLAVAGIVALADSDDDDNNNNNDDNNNGGDPGDGDDDDDTPTPNNAPTLASVPEQTVIENGDVTFTVNASDADGDDLVFSASSPTNGTVTQTISGTFKYEPNPDFSGSDTFTVSVSDGRGGTDIVAVNITITPAPNEAPVFDDSDAEGNREVATDENTDVIIQLNASDADGDDLTFALDSQTTANGGEVRFLEGSSDKVVYTPATNYVGSDTFDVTVSDGNGGTATQTINMRVDIINTAPVAEDDTFTVNEDVTTELDVLANDSDSDNTLDGTSITLLTDVSNGTLTYNNDGTFSYTPDADFNGNDSFVYTLADSDGASDTATATITVEAVNDAPVAVDDALTIDEDSGASTLDVLANDSDVDNSLEGTNITLLTGVSNGTLVYNGDGTFDYIPDAEFSGSDSFTYTLTDPNGASDTATVSITVDAVNDAPVNTMPADQTSDKNTDLDIPGLSVADIDVGSGDITVTLEVSNGTLSVGGTATLTNNNTGSVTLFGSLAAVNSSLADVTYTPSTGFTGDDTLTVTTDDGGNTGAGGAQTDVDSITITVTDTAAIIAGNLTGSVTEDDPSNTASGNLTATDPDGGDEVFQAQTGTEGTYGSFDLGEDGSWTYTLDNTDPDTDALKEGQVAEDSFSIQTADGTTETVTVSVTGANDAPVAQNDEATVDEDNSVNISVIDNDEDPEGELANSTFAVETGPSNGEVTNNDDGTFTYTPDANFNGSDSFTYSITDPDGGVDTATVDITINPVADPIALAPQNYYLIDGSAPQTVSIDVENPDATGTLTYTVLDNPQFGSLTTSTSDNEYVYTPDAGFIGRDTIRVRVTNGESDPVFQVINIFVDEDIINGVILDAADEEQNGSSGDDRYYGVLGDSSDNDALNLTTFTTGDSIFASLGTDTLFLDISAHAGGLDDTDFAGTLSNLEILKLGQGDNLVSLGTNAEVAGIRTVIGNSGNDTLDVSDYTLSDEGVELVGGDGDDTLIGGQGEDYLDGGLGNDTLKGTDVNQDTFVISSGQDIVEDLNTNDILLVASGASVEATVLFDFIATGDTANEGSATILLGTASEVDLSLAGGPNGYTVEAGDTASSLTGSAFDDVLRGGIESDILDGGDGNDLLVGGDGDDDITAGDGLDIIGGLLGNDDITLNADAVLDEVHFRTGDGSDTVTGFEVTADGIFFLDGDGSNGSVAFTKDDSADGAAGTLFTAGDTDDYEEFAVAADFTANANGLSDAVALLDDPALTDDLLDALTSSATNTYLVVENATTSQVQILFDDDWSSAGDYEVVATFTDLADTSGLDVTNFGIY